MPFSSELPDVSEPLNRPILRLAIPSVIATLSVPLVGIADTALVGHLPEMAFMGAVAVGSVVLDVLFWGCAFLRMGTTALVAQYHGAGRPRACSDALLQALLIGLLLGVALILVREFIAAVGFRAAGGSDEVSLWAQRYFAVRILSAPLVLTTFVVSGFFRGLADAITPMWMIVLIHVTNVLGDYALIFGKWGAPELGVIGAAWASVLAYGVGAVFGVTALACRYRGYIRFRWGAALNGASLRLMAGTHVNLFGRTACLLFAQFLMLSLVARMGEGPLAAHAVLWQVWSLVSYCVDGFAHAAETLVGMRLGAGAFAEARKVARRCLWWGGLIGLAYCLTYFAGIRTIASLFTVHEPVALAVVGQVIWVAACQPLNGVVFILDGVLIGANDTRYLFGAMAGASFLIYLPVTVVLVWILDLGLAGAWMGYNALMVGRFGTLMWRYKGHSWERNVLGQASDV